MLEQWVEVCRLRVRIERYRLAVSRGDQMREVRSLADTLRTTVLALKAKTNKSIEGFQSEVQRAHDNNGKVDSLTKELKLANQEVEAVLGDTGSNFPTSEEGQLYLGDGNGVGTNPDAREPVKSDPNGVRTPDAK